MIHSIPLGMLMSNTLFICCDLLQRYRIAGRYLDISPAGPAGWCFSRSPGVLGRSSVCGVPMVCLVLTFIAGFDAHRREAGIDRIIFAMLDDDPFLEGWIEDDIDHFSIKKAAPAAPAVVVISIPLFSTVTFLSTA